MDDFSNFRNKRRIADRTSRAVGRSSRTHVGFFSDEQSKDRGGQSTRRTQDISHCAQSERIKLRLAGRKKKKKEKERNVVAAHVGVVCTTETLDGIDYARNG